MHSERGCTLLRLQGLQSAKAKSMPLVVTLQQLYCSACQICWFYHTNRVGCAEQVYDVAKIFSVRAYKDRNAMLCRFQNIVAAGWHKAPADDGQIRQSVEVCQFANRIYQQDAAVQRRARPLRTKAKLQAGLL